jgi:prophage antirepressor-like protein
MNTSPINFEFNTNGVNNTIRVIEIEGEPWFVSADALNAMGYPRDGHKMIRKKLGDNEKGVKRIATLGGPQNTSIISESGLYKLVMRSDKPEARAFQDWVTGVVLPDTQSRLATLQGGGETQPPYRRGCPTHLHHSRG